MSNSLARFLQQLFASLKLLFSSLLQLLVSIHVAFTSKPLIIYTMQKSPKTKSIFDDCQFGGHTLATSNLVWASRDFSPLHGKSPDDQMRLISTKHCTGTFLILRLFGHMAACCRTPIGRGDAVCFANVLRRQDGQ